jgi:SAM-dependent methyltransferase
MEPEGMVHALEEIHRILKPTGTLIEIHPAVDSPPVVEVRSAGTVTFSEADPGFDYLDDLRRAEEAVATALDRGVFVIHERRRFELRTHAASVEELRDHWAAYGAYDPEEKDPGIAERQDRMYGRAHEALRRWPGAELVYIEPATMSRLTPSPASSRG